MVDPKENNEGERKQRGDYSGNNDDEEDGSFIDDAYVGSDESHGREYININQTHTILLSSEYDANEVSCDAPGNNYDDGVGYDKNKICKEPNKDSRHNNGSCGDVIVEIDLNNQEENGSYSAIKNMKAVYDEGGSFVQNVAIEEEKDNAAGQLGAGQRHGDFEISNAFVQQRDSSNHDRDDSDEFVYGSGCRDAIMMKGRSNGIQYENEGGEEDGALEQKHAHQDQKGFDRDIDKDGVSDYSDDNTSIYQNSCPLSSSSSNSSSRRSSSSSSSRSEKREVNVQNRNDGSISLAASEVITGIYRGTGRAVRGDYDRDVDSSGSEDANIVEQITQEDEQEQNRAHRQHLMTLSAEAAKRSLGTKAQYARVQAKFALPGESNSSDIAQSIVTGGVGITENDTFSVQSRTKKIPQSFPFSTSPFSSPLSTSSLLALRPTPSLLSAAGSRDGGVALQAHESCEVEEADRLCEIARDLELENAQMVARKMVVKRCFIEKGGVDAGPRHVVDFAGVDADAKEGGTEEEEEEEEESYIPFQPLASPQRSSSLAPSLCEQLVQGCISNGTIRVGSLSNGGEGTGSAEGNSVQSAHSGTSVACEMEENEDGDNVDGATNARAKGVAVALWQAVTAYTKAISDFDNPNALSRTLCLSSPLSPPKNLSSLLSSLSPESTSFLQQLSPPSSMLSTSTSSSQLLPTRALISAHYGRALALNKLRKYTQALMDINCVLALLSESTQTQKGAQTSSSNERRSLFAPVWNVKGHLMLRIGMEMEGLTCLRHAVRLAPDMPCLARDYYLKSKDLSAANSSDQLPGAYNSDTRS